MTRFPTVLVAACLFFPTALHAQTSSGPSTGSKIEPLKVFAVTGDNAGEEFDFAAKHAGKPAAFLFVQADKFDRPIGRFLKVLDQELSKDRSDVPAIAIWLTDDVEKSKEYLTRAQMSINLHHIALAVYPGDKNGPQGWAINTGAHLSVILANDNRVISTFGFRSVNDLDVPNVLAKLPPKK